MLAERFFREAACAIAGCVLAATTACSTQSPYVPTHFNDHPVWANQSGNRAFLLPPNEDWWSALDDPVLSGLIESALASSPSLALAEAHLAEARATLGLETSLSHPQISLSGSGGRARIQSSSGASTTQVGNSITGGPTFAWEIDLFGRLRGAQDAAASRLDARNADAQSARLLLSSQVAGALVSLRACRFGRGVKRDDIASRERDLALTRRRVALGFAPPVDESRAISGLEDARASLISQDESCVKDRDALVALSGLTATEIDARITLAGFATDQHKEPAYPRVPQVALALPATVLSRHPAVIAAEREAAATYAEIGVARANRLPVINLTSALTGNWISASGSTLSFLGWSLMSGISAPLFDAGGGAASVDAATARYLAALASLHSTLRNTAQDIEDALTEQSHAGERLAAAIRARDAARATLDATESQWRAGAVNLFQLEDTRRQREAADQTAIDASRASIQAWIDIVRASGNAAAFVTTPMHQE
ncbi:efflux transporter outer membrane subunit [Paraburkholderia sp. GAS32]|uniref:efflux transporter outer membrane subunit n=1 Tax=Paraburkholderia sp. GAS32 TaxID=3035129 RepID=UPI003D21783E